MTDPLLLLPLDAIDEAALPRDRTAPDPTALDELRASIAAQGLRQPIEVFELAQPEGRHRYALISGFRRLTALRALHALTGLDRHATIPAFVRSPQTLTAALQAMVEENDIRTDISPWEKGRIPVVTRNEGLFPNLDAAIDALYPNATRQRRHRIRALARVVEDLDGHLATPETLSLRQMTRLAACLQNDFADLLRHILSEHPGASLARQWTAILPALIESETAHTDPTPYAPGRPRRLAYLPRGLVLRREKTPRGWTLHFTGAEATEGLMEEVLDEVERWLGK